MTRPKPKFSYGQQIFHRALEESKPGIVTGVVDRGSVFTYEIDWGPDSGSGEHHEVTLTDTFTQKFGG